MSNGAKIGDRIPLLMKELGLDAVSDLEKGPDWNPAQPETRLISNGLISDWAGRSIDWTSDKLEKFLNGWKINKKWWKTGEGEVFITSVHKEPAITGKTLRGDPEVYRTIVEGNTEYILVHREQFQNDRKIMDHLLTENEKMTAKILELETQPPGVKKGKHGA